MTTAIGALLAYLLLDWPWWGVVIAVLLCIDAVEIYIWLRWRKKRSITGPEGVVGLRGKVLRDCAPEGQVRVKGQVWSARSSEPVSVGQDITVTDVDGVRLKVEPAPARPVPASAPPP